MKNFKLVFCFFFMMILSLSIQAQSKVDVFDSEVPVTWLGVDFTALRFIGPASGWGSESTKSPSEMRDTYFQAWNDMIKKEPQNFKIAEAISRIEISSWYEAVEKVNEKTNKKEIFSESSSDYQTLTEEEIKKMVKQYDIKKMKGIGFVLIAEGMNKNIEEASYWATFIDLSTKQVLFTKQVTGKAVGFGFRNYWLGSIKNVFKKMKKEFKNWN